MEKVSTDGQEGIGGGDGTSDGQKWAKADGTSRGGEEEIGGNLGNLGFFKNINM